MLIFCVGSVFVLVPNTVTRRSSVSCHAEKIQHSNRLSLINFYRESKVEDLIVSLIASLCQFVGFAYMAGRAAEKCVERWCNAFEIQFRILKDFFMCLERLLIMKNGNQQWSSTNRIRACIALLHISHMIARCT